MDRKQFVTVCDEKLKFIRTEYSLSQEKMALILGLSKKTLVEIEKRRSSLGWTGSVALCALFNKSKIIADTFGDDYVGIIDALAFEGDEPSKQKTVGAGIWWKTIEESEKGFIQQHVILQSYRLLDHEGNRLISSLNMEDLDLYAKKGVER